MTELSVSTVSASESIPDGRLRQAACLIACWMIVILTGFGALVQYESAPGAVEQAPVSWPDDVDLLQETGCARLVMFAHPRCSCTRASLAELQRLLARLKNPPQTAVVFIRPAGASDKWTETPTQKCARAIPGVQVVCDAAGRLSQRFGAATSGHVLLYDRDGALRFSGGMTASRGQAGNSPAAETLAARLHGTGIADASYPVFGCPLFDPAALSLAKDQCPAKGTK